MWHVLKQRVNDNVPNSTVSQSTPRWIMEASCAVTQWSPDCCKSCPKTLWSVLTLVPSAPAVLRLYMWGIWRTSRLHVEACLVLYSFGQGGNIAPPFFFQCVFHHTYHSRFLPECLSFLTWMSTPSIFSVFWQSHHPSSKHAVCNTSSHCYLSFWYTFLCTYRTKLVNTCMLEFPTFLGITSVCYEFFNRKGFPSGVHVPLLFKCPAHIPPPYPTSHAIPSTPSVHYVPQPVLCVPWVFCYFLCDCVKTLLPCCWVENTAVELLPAGKSIPVCNIHVKLDVYVARKDPSVQ